MANQQQHLLTAIDVGSAKTCVLVAEITEAACATGATAWPNRAARAKA